MKFKTYLLAEAHYGSLVDPDKYKQLDKADQSLYKYTADGSTALVNLDKLIKRYPNEAGTLYRGLHFDDQEQHDSFLAKIEDGTFESEYSSSWTPSKPTAEDFAHSKKTYFPDMMIMMAHEKMRNEGEHMSGYGGVVISTEVKAGVGCDVNKSDFAKESEVILPGGTYKIKIVKLVEPFKRTYNSIEKMGELIKELKMAKERDSELDKKLEFAIRSWLPKLGEADADVLLGYVAKKFFKMSDAELKDKYSSFEIRDKSWMKGNHRLEFSVHVPVDSRIFDKCSPKMQELVRKKLKIIAKGASEKLALVAKDPNIDKVDEFDIDGLTALRHYIPDEAAAVGKPIRAILGDRYHSMNSREYNKTLKTSDDFSKHAEKIGNIVKAMGKI